MMSMCLLSQAQTPGYYNSVEGKAGDDLKAVLHTIITGHTDFSYNESKYILEYAQEDPANSSNYLQFYTDRSVTKGTGWGSGLDFSNREHIWAASHGDFRDINPMNGDLHNLHAADGSVNVTRSNFDFDEVEGGTYIEEADAYYSSADNAFEPSDAHKGAVARTLFYMATRYEGENGELDFEMADATGTAPNATHGKLSTLLQWNRDFPPTDYERRRNDVVELSQSNRNPFIDHPEYADMIWDNTGGNSTNIIFNSLTPAFPHADEDVVVEVTISSLLAVAQTAKLYWGTSYNSETNVVDFTGSAPMTATLSLAGFSANEQVFMKVVTSAGGEEHASFLVNTPAADKMSIADAQGTGDASSVSGVVTIDGVVTSNLDNVFTMQTTNDVRSGITVYSYFRGQLGDSISVTGTVVEYNKLTEMSNVTALKNYGFVGNREPIELTIDQLNEDYEGMLVKIKGVYFVDGGGTFPDGGTYPFPSNYAITDGNNSINFYVRYYSRFCNTVIPSGTVDVTAVVGQYNSDYQLMSNDTSWIDYVNDVNAPQVVELTVESKDDTYTWIILKFNEIITEDAVEDEDNYSITDGVTVARAYYSDATPNVAKLLVKGIKVQDYTITVANIEDRDGNKMDSTDIDFTSKVSTSVGKMVGDFTALYPNPVDQGILTIVCEDRIESVQVFSMQGQVLLVETNVASAQYDFDVAHLTHGNYIIKAKTQSGVFVQKFSVQ